MDSPQRRSIRLAAAVAALLLLAAAPVDGHVGGAAGVRPVAIGVDPPRPGIAVDAVFAGEWQVRVTNHSADEVAVVDDAGRPYLRIGPGGVQADFRAPAWYRAATTGAERLPPGVVDGSEPDWRPVSVTPEWSWFDPAIRAEPGLVPDGPLPDDPLPDNAAKLRTPFRLRDWEIAVRVGTSPARLTGYLEFEPASGFYRHRITSAPVPATGVTVGLVAGQAIPVLTLENAGSAPVTVIGGAGEAFARVGGRDEGKARVVVEVNQRSPAWLDVLRFLQRVPIEPAAGGAEPRWQVMAEGYRWSWPEFRGRPPDEEPPPAVVAAGRPVTVRRWTVPLRLGDHPVEVQGTTEFVPVVGRRGGRPGLPGAVIAGALLAVATVFVIRRRRSPRSQSRNGQARLVKRVM